MDVAFDLAEFRRYADYKEAADVTRARHFVTVCTRLIGVPDSGSSFGDELRLPDKAQLRKLIDDAESWIKYQNPTIGFGQNAGYIGVDFTDYRR